MLNRCVIRCGAAICLVGCGCAEAAELGRPAQPVCDDRPEVRDIGVPAGCGDAIGSHSRSVRLTSLASSTVTLTPALVTVPLAAVSVYDADEPATAVDQRCQPTSLCSSSSMSIGDISTRIVGFTVTPGRWPPRQVR
jgi:hypothetical protein